MTRFNTSIEAARAFRVAVPEGFSSSSKQKRGGSEFVRGVKRGTVQLGSDALALGSIITDAFGFEGATDFLIREAIDLRELANSESLRARVRGIEDISSFGEGASYVMGILGEQFPNILSLIASGGVGGAIGKTAGRLAAKKALKGTARKVGLNAERKAMRAKLREKGLSGRASDATIELMQQRGAFAMATAVSMGINIGEEQINIVQETGQWRPGVAMSFGAMSGALDILPMFRIFDKLGVSKAAKKAIISDVIKKGFLRKEVIKGVGTQFVYEGLTEGAQTIIENSGLKFVDNNHTIFEGKGLQILNAVTAGAIVGGAVGGVASRVSARNTQQAALADEEKRVREKAVVGKEEARKEGVLKNEQEREARKSVREIKPSQVPQVLVVKEEKEFLAEHDLKKLKKKKIGGVTVYGRNFGKKNSQIQRVEFPKDWSPESRVEWLNARLGESPQGRQQELDLKTAAVTDKSSKIEEAETEKFDQFSGGSLKGNPTLAEVLINFSKTALGKIANLKNPADLAGFMSSIETTVNKDGTPVDAKNIKNLAVSTNISYDDLDPHRQAGLEMVRGLDTVPTDLKEALTEAWKKQHPKRKDVPDFSDLDVIEHEISDMLPLDAIKFVVNLANASENLSPDSQRRVRFLTDTMFGEGAGSRLFGIGPEVGAKKASDGSPTKLPVNLLATVAEETKDQQNVETEKKAMQVGDVVQPIVLDVDDNGNLIIHDGNTRVRAASELNLKNLDVRIHSDADKKKVIAAIQKLRNATVKTAPKKDQATVTSLHGSNPNAPHKDRKGQSVGATEGTGLYVTKQKGLAEQFGDVDEVSHLEPENPLVVKDEVLPFAENDPVLIERALESDSDWIRLNKQAAKNVGINAENFGKVLSGTDPLARRFQEELSRLVLAEGFDAISISKGNLRWQVLTDPSLHSGKDLGIKQPKQQLFDFMLEVKGDPRFKSNAAMLRIGHSSEAVNLSAARETGNFWYQVPLAKNKLLNEAKEEGKAIVNLRADMKRDSMGMVRLFANRFLKTSVDEIASSGKHGQQLAATLMLYGDMTQRRLVVVKHKLALIDKMKRTTSRPLGRLTGAERVHLGRILEGKDKPKNALMKQKAADLKRLYKWAALVAEKSGVKVLMQNGKKRDFKARKDYNPRAYKDGVREGILSGSGKYYKIAMDHLIQKEGMTPEEAAEALHFTFGKDGSGQFGNLERERITKLPSELFETDAILAAEKYFAGFWPRIHEIQMFENAKSVKDHLNDIAKESSDKSRTAAKKGVDEILGKVRVTEFTAQVERKYLRPLRTFNVIRLLGIAISPTVKQLTQVSSAISKYGFLNFTASIYEVAKSTYGGKFGTTRSATTRLLDKSGALKTSALERAAHLDPREVTTKGVLDTVADAVIFPFQITDNIGRRFGGVMALRGAEQTLKHLRTGGRRLLTALDPFKLGVSNKQIRLWEIDMLNKLGVKDVSTAIKNGKFSRADQLNILQRGANELFFQTGPKDLPRGWAANPYARTLLQFYSFAWKQGALAGDFIANEALRKNNPWPIARLLSVSFGAGELAQYFLNSVLPDEEKDRTETSTIRRVINDIVFVGTLGIVADAFMSDMNKPHLGPTGDLVQTLAANIKRVTIAAVSTDISLTDEAFEIARESLKGVVAFRDIQEGKSLFTAALRLAGGDTSRTTKTSARRNFDNVIAKLSSAKKESTSGGALGSRTATGQRSKLWEAAQRSVDKSILSPYTQFELEMRKRISRGGNGRQIVDGLISSRQPFRKFRSLNREEKRIFLKAFGNIRDPESGVRDEFREAAIYHRVIAAQLRLFYTRFARDNRNFIREKRLKFGSKRRVG